MFRNTKTQMFLLKNNNVNFNLIKGTKTNLVYNQKRHQSNFFNPGFITPTVKFLLIGNTTVYFMSYFMSKREYVTNFFYHRLALRNNKAHTLITTHFAKVSFFDWLLETVFTGLVGSQLEMQMGTPYFRRLILSSAGLGSIFLILMHHEDAFIKSEAIFRGLIMYIVFQNPYTHFYLFPLPFRVQALWIGIIVVVLDLISQRWVNFGGTLAAYLMIRGFI